MLYTNIVSDKNYFIIYKNSNYKKIIRADLLGISVATKGLRI